MATLMNYEESFSQHFQLAPNKRMQSDQSARYARTLAADAERSVDSL
jgi:hypothetical protein